MNNIGCFYMFYMWTEWNNSVHQDIIWREDAWSGPHFHLPFYDQDCLICLLNKKTFQTQFWKFNCIFQVLKCSNNMCPAFFYLTKMAWNSFVMVNLYGFSLHSAMEAQLLTPLEYLTYKCFLMSAMSLSTQIVSLFY